MTWEVLFCFRQILLLCWCHYTCLLYSLIKQLPGWDSIAEFLSVLDNTVSSSLLSLASDCSERLQVPLVWWPYIFCQGSALVFYNWSHRWGSHVLWCSFSKDCQGSAMNDVPQYFAEVEFPICTVLSFLSRDSAKFCVRLSSDFLLTLMLGIPCFFEVWNFFGCTAESWTPDGCLYESLCWGLVLKYELVIHRLWKVHSSSRCAGCFRSFCLRLINLPRRIVVCTYSGVKSPKRISCSLFRVLLTTNEMFP